MRPSDSITGRIVSHYRVVEMLGRGGMGVVYKAEDTRLHRVVALKLVSNESAQNLNALERFRREAEAASALNHPNICTIYDFGEEKGQAFIAMEYLDGQTLKDRIASHPLSLAQVLDLGAEIADALDTAHQLGVVHRDIKPANIFIIKRGHAKILDFGLAKLKPKPTGQTTLTGDYTFEGPTEVELTRSGTMMGTAAYMSPEQVRGEVLDARTDIFSFGIVLYEMATGRVAFNGARTGVVAEAILNRQPESLRRLVSYDGLELERIVTKALDKDRNRRYQTAAEIHSDLLAYRSNISAVPASQAHVDYRGSAPAGAAHASTVSANKPNEDLHQLVEPSPVSTPHQIVGPRTLPRLRVAIRTVAAILPSIGQSSAASSKRWTWIAVAGGALAAIVLALYTWQRSAASPVHAIRQLTNDAVPKGAYLKLATDGIRVYFNEGEFGSTRVSEVAVSGGPTAVLPISLPSPQLAGLSPNGSSLLVTANGMDKGEGRDAAIAHQSLWTVPLPAGEPRRLGDISAAEATYLQDGRILFAQGLDLYTADADGSNSHKLLGLGTDFAEITEIAASPDGSRIVFLAQKNREWTDMQLMVIATDGTGLHTVVRNRTVTEPICCVNWSRDGRFVLYAVRSQTSWDLWACPDGSSFLRHSGSPVQLTAGPLSYTQPIPSRDGNQILAVGTQYRGELVRYDAHSKQFVPILSGISAWGPTYSANGSWVTYTSFPDQTLWRSRADGSERKQLTFPPMMVSFPFISPDGKRVAFGTREGDLYLINTDGSQLQKFGSRVSLAPNWSPDGTQLVFTLVTTESRELRLFNVQTGEITASPQLAGFGGGQWVGANEFVAFSTKDLTMKIYNLKTQAWSDLLSGTIVNWAHSPDWKYLYYTTGGSDPRAMRVRLSDHKIETITSLKGIRRALDPSGKTQMGVAPDGSPVFTRDIGTQEIYSLTVK